MKSKARGKRGVVWIVALALIMTSVFAAPLTASAATDVTTIREITILSSRPEVVGKTTTYTILAPNQTTAWQNEINQGLGAVAPGSSGRIDSGTYVPQPSTAPDGTYVYIPYGVYNNVTGAVEAEFFGATGAYNASPPFKFSKTFTEAGNYTINVGWEVYRSGGGLWNYVTEASGVFTIPVKKPAKFKVTFKPEKGKFKKGAKKSKNANYGEKYGKLPSVSRKGYRLLGWFTGKAGTEIDKNSYMQLYKKHNVKARWLKKGKGKTLTNAEINIIQKNLDYGLSYADVKAVIGGAGKNLGTGNLKIRGYTYKGKRYSWKGPKGGTIKFLFSEGELLGYTGTLKW